MKRIAAVVAAATAASADASGDWLLYPPQGPSPFKAEVLESNTSLEIRNGLVSRTFTFAPAFGTVHYALNATAQYGGSRQMLRAIKPEAMISLDGASYSIGGLVQNPLSDGSIFTAYLNESDLTMSMDQNAFKYSRHVVKAPSAPFPWTPGTRHAPADAVWPPAGKELAVTFTAPTTVAKPTHSAIEITVHYAIYDGAPLLSKWVTVEAVKPTTADVVVTSISVEVLALNAEFGSYMTHGSFVPGGFNAFGGAPGGRPNPLFNARTDQAHGGTCTWFDDYPRSKDVGGSLKDEGAVEPSLNCSYNIGPGAHVSMSTKLHGGVAARAIHDPDIATTGSESFTSFKVFELAMDSWDVERQSLARHRSTQLLAPHVLENPVFFHATDISESGFKNAIDQMAEVGFEMLIFSFGSGFRLETADKAYLNKIKGQIAYAKSKGIEVGGYDLICLARGHGGYGGNVGDQWDAVNTDGSLSSNACFASGWYDKLHGYVLDFVNETGLAMLETDGPYGGGECSSTKHAYHHGLEDSVYKQTRMQSQFYNEMRSYNVFINQPDNYFFQGGQKTGMGYSEQQYSLPRFRDLTISRAGMYDDLYEHLPTQGWMFLPIVDYHSGGDAAAFAPHGTFQLEAYEQGLAQYLGAGVAACYRGNKLYDNDATKAVVAKWVSFYKAHRQVLIQPVVHLRRPDMQGWDGWLHVRPTGAANSTEVAVAMIFNPTDKAVAATVSLPLYYAGLSTDALVSVNGATAVKHTVLRDYSVPVAMSMPPRSIHTIVVSTP
eukprot:TRINITY_DN1026_c0_g1_i1.p1 TRINITY_DN1026_c0_g1~~TRINITY_DN1026_c0_g1_i1.p1  ORF type:complete len:774 (+),score=191.91 TRINITY_DN1026_c0_g1_i1:58-2379(+)